MLITAVCWWVALSLSSGALRADQQEPPPPRRVLTVDDVLRIEEIGDVALSPDGRWLAYVIKRPRVSASDHSRSYLGGNDRGDVWIVPIEGGEPRNVTNGAAAGAGYWAPGWSSDSRRLAMLSTKGGSVRLWIWDRQSNGLRRVTDDAVDMPTTGVPPYSWMSPTTLAVAVLPAGENPAGWRLQTHGPSRAMSEWPRAWRGERTVNVLESGVPSTFDSRRKGRLLLVNAATGGWKTVTTGNVRQLQVSPDARHVAFLTQIEFVRPIPGQILFNHQGNNERYQLGIAAAGGQSIASSMSDAREVLSGSVAWSPDGASVAFIGWARDDGVMRAYRYRVNDRSLEMLNTGGLPLSAPTEAGGPRSTIRWSARGDLVLFNRDPGVTTSNRYDWWLLRDDRAPANLTRELKGVPSSILAMKDSHALVGVAGGEVWIIDAAAETSRSLTDGFQPYVSAIAWPTRAPSSGTDQIVVRVRGEGASELATLDLSTAAIAPLASPVPGAAFRDFVSRPTIAAFSLTGPSSTDLWLMAPAAKINKVVAHLNAFLEQVAQGELRRVDYAALDGTKLTGWLILPANYREGERYPLIASVYGGDVFGDTPPSDCARGGVLLGALSSEQASRIRTVLGRGAHRSEPGEYPGHVGTHLRLVRSVSRCGGEGIGPPADTGSLRHVR
jgi:dipeptidyl aminopeptidase/acylaminoacyl peptidase